MAVIVEFNVPNLWDIFKWCEDCKKEMRDGVEGRKGEGEMILKQKTLAFTWPLFKSGNKKF